MARNFLTPINLNGLELQDASIQAKTTAAINAITPASGGRIYFDSQTNTLKLYNGSAWASIATGGSTFTLGSTSVAIGATVTTVAGLTLSGPTFTGNITTPLSTGYVTANATGVLSSVSTIPNSGLTSNSISGIVLGNNLATLTISSPLSGTSYNGSTGVTIALASGYGDSQNPYASKTANFVLAAPNGSNGAPTFRILAAADIPQLGNITNAGAIGSTSGLVVSTTTSGVLTASSALPNGTTATTQASANNSTHVATTAYVDTAVFNGQAGFNVHAAVVAASTTNITGTYTAGSADASNGTGIGATFVFTAAQIDGVTLAATNRVLLKDQTNKVHNGVYVVTTVSANITLTRASDFDNSVAGEVFNGDLIYIAGTGTQAGTTWVMNTQGTATTPAGAVKIGTDNINWVQFAGAGTYTGSNGVSVSGTVISGVDATTGAKGVASFTNTQFTVSSGAVSITNLAASVILSGTLAAARGGTGADLSGANSTQYGIPYFTSAGVMASTAAGASTQVLIGNASGAPSWTNISGLTVSAATSSTTVNVTESTTAATYYPVFSPSTTTGQKALLQNSGANLISFNPSTGTLTTTGFSGSGAALTNIPAANVTGTLTSTVLGNSAVFIGTTSVALNRTSAALALTGITSVNGLVLTASTGTLTLANSSTLATVGAFSTTLTATATTSVTLPTSGTLTSAAATLTAASILKGDGGSAVAVASSAEIAAAIGSSTVTNSTNATNSTNVNITDTISGTTWFPVFAPSSGTGQKALTMNAAGAFSVSFNNSTGNFYSSTGFSTSSTGSVSTPTLSATVDMNIRPDAVAANPALALTVAGGENSGTTTATAGALTVRGGAATGTSGTTTGGALALQGGAGSANSAGLGGSVTVNGGNGGSSTGTGGSVTIIGGTGSTRGNVLIGTNTNNTGSITIGATTAGIGGATAASSQTITIGSLSNISAAGPNDTTVRGTNNSNTATTGSPRAGHLVLSGGSATGSGASTVAFGGDVLITGGNFTTASGRLGDIFIGASTTRNIEIGTGVAAAGTLLIGSTTGTGALTFGQSTAAQTVNIATGANSSAAKVLNLGTGGSGSTTTVNINTSTGGSTVINGAVRIAGQTTNGLVSYTSTNGTLGLAAAGTDYIAPYGSTTANQVLASPNGSTGTPSFRALVAADIPTLNQNTTGSAGSVTNSLVIKADSGTTEGTDLYTFNGSAAKTLNLVSGTGVTIAETSGTFTFNNSGVTSLNGSTGALGASANTNGSYTRYHRATCAAALTTAINHGLGQWVLVQVYKTSDGTIADVDVTNTSTSGGTTTVGFATAPGAGDYTIVIIG